MVVALKEFLKGLVRFWLFKVVIVKLGFAMTHGYGNINQLSLTPLKQRVETFQVCHECHKFKFNNFTMWLLVN